MASATRSMTSADLFQHYQDGSQWNFPPLEFLRHLDNALKIHKCFPQAIKGAAQDLNTWPGITGASLAFDAERRHYFVLKITPPGQETETVVVDQQTVLETQGILSSLFPRGNFSRETFSNPPFESGLLCGSRDTDLADHLPNMEEQCRLACLIMNLFYSDPGIKWETYQSAEKLEKLNKSIPSISPPLKGLDGSERTGRYTKALFIRRKTDIPETP